MTYDNESLPRLEELWEQYVVVTKLDNVLINLLPEIAAQQKLEIKRIFVAGAMAAVECIGIYNPEIQEVDVIEEAIKELADDLNSLIESLDAQHLATKEDNILPFTKPH